MSDKWNKRYGSPEYAYGVEPNLFFKDQLGQLKPGSILLPADGEGRNGVYAASQNWKVSAFDISTVGRTKALKLAAVCTVEISYDVHDCQSASYPENHFDAIALVFAHLPPKLRYDCHQKMITFLKPGGTLMLEGFHTSHLKYNSVNPKAGGPKDIGMLFDADLLRSDFKTLDILSLEQIDLYLKEGEYHDGVSAIIRLVARKPF